MRTSEWVVVGYLLYLVLTAALLRAPAASARLVAVLAALTSGVVVSLARLGDGAVSVVRDWLPGIWVLVGYWMTGHLYRGPNQHLEGWLESIDLRLLARRGPPRLPRAAREALESAYLFCYPLVPTGIAVLYLARRAERADAYWTLVLVSAFAAYAVLPWAGTRPPRALPNTGRWNCADSGGGGVCQRLNLAVLARGSIQVNTFPSGHAASSWAVALFMTTVPGVPWPVFVAVAGAIAAGAVIGRYHYLLDVLAGIGVALLAFALLPSR